MPQVARIRAPTGGAATLDGAVMRRTGAALLQAVASYLAGRRHDAERFCRQALELDPRGADAAHLLGLILCEGGQFTEAASWLLQAATLEPTSARAHNDLANCLRELGQRGDALVHYQQAIELDANLGEAHANLGAALKDLGHLDEAAAALRRAVQARPKLFAAWANLAQVQTDLGQFEAAKETLRSALPLAPSAVAAHCAQGLIALGRERTEEAASYFQEALRRDPNSAEAHLYLATVRREERRFDEAEASCARAVAGRPTWASARIERARLYLTQERFEPGWAEYEWREAAHEGSRDASASPRWDGTPLDRRALLVRSEQGIGTVIMFASCLSDVLIKNARVIVECDSRLVPLFRRSFPAAELVRKEAAEKRARAGDVAAQIPIGSLPRIYRPHAACFAGAKPYLRPDESRVSYWRRQLQSLGTGPKIGISWRGGGLPRQRFRRSTTLNHWAILAGHRDVRFVNLQFDATPDEIDRANTHLGLALHSFAELNLKDDLDNLAALVTALDLVITVDNSTAHLAGALGRETWTLLPFAASWRWFLSPSECLWYPSMRLFRQPKAGDWAAVFAEVNAQRFDIVRHGASIPPAHVHASGMIGTAKRAKLQ